MSRNLRALTPLLIIFLAVPSYCLARTSAGAVSGDDTSRGFSLLVLAQAAPHFTSPNSYADGGYSVSLGFGLNFSSAFQLALVVYTGREMIPSERPVAGWLPLGGASLEATYFFTRGGALRPYGSAGYGLYTLNGGDGYNGGGGNFEAGIEWDFSRYLSLRGGASFSIIRFHDPTGEASQAAGFEPFTLRTAGAALRCTFYPSVLP